MESHRSSVKDNRALRVSAGGRRAGRCYFRRDVHWHFLTPEVELTEDKVGQMPRETTGLKDFHLAQWRVEDSWR